MCEKIASLDNLSQWVQSTLSIIALCSIATSLLSACDDGPQSTTVTAVPTSVLTPTTTHAPALIEATSPDIIGPDRRPRSRV